MDSPSVAHAQPLIDPRRRLAGMLAPVFALRHHKDFGIGDTLAVRDAIDFCAQEGFSILQILPIHETVGDHSPYGAVSSCALSPALLALTEEDVPGLDIAKVEAAAPASWLAQLRVGPVKYNSVVPLKFHLLQAAHRGFRRSHGPESPLGNLFTAFQKENASWLPAYTLFRLLVGEYEGNPNWSEWRPEHQTVAAAEAWFANSHDHAALEIAREGLAYIQWVAFNQWRSVRLHAEKQKVLLMGEMSFGVGRNSVDVWSRPDLFDLDWNTGTRPIAYFDTNKDSEKWGQNWGLPPYRWENHRTENFAWLRRRVEMERRFFHLCRLDHLRGYFRAYMFPWQGGAQHAEFAKLSEEEIRAQTGGRLPRFVPGADEDPTAAQLNGIQGREILGVIRQAAGNMDLVGEIMGALPDYMRQTLDDLAIANLTFPQLERNADRSLHDPSTFRALSLASYGNHDHAPLAHLYQNLLAHSKDPRHPTAIDLPNLLRFVGWDGPAPQALTDELLARFQRALLATPCALAVFLVSDVFGVPLRFNLPGSYGAGTWCERFDLPLKETFRHSAYSPRLATLRKEILETGRLPQAQAKPKPAPLPPPAARNAIPVGTP